MTVRNHTIYRGPHLYSATPMIRIELDLGALEAWPSNRIPDFPARLTAALPGLHEHGCSLGERGGFLQRLAEGTWLGHVMEHVALELQTRAGHRATRGKTRSVRGAPGVYNVMFAYLDEQMGLAAGRFALELVDSLLPPHLAGAAGTDRLYPRAAPRLPSGDVDVAAVIEELRRIGRRSAFGPTTQAIVDEARRRGIPVMPLDDGSLVQLGTGCHQKRVRASVTGDTRSLAVEAAGDKDLCKRLLRQAGVPAPAGQTVRSLEGALEAARALGWPVVVKPLDGNHGRGVTLDVEDPQALQRAFDEARQHSRRVIVEQQYRGHDHRLLVIGGRLAAAAERVPARVVGDGARSVAELIEEANRDPRRGEGHEQFMTRITVDEHVQAVLAKAGLALSHVPAPGAVVQLRDTANLSTGGTAVDRTEDVHPDNAWLAERAARVLGLDVAGIDMIAPDIGRSILETGGGIVEVNASPGFRMHLQPSEGRPRNVARPVIDMLFPAGARTRVPLLAITGTNGKSTTARMVAHIYASLGRTVGLTSTTGIYVGGRRIADVDASGPRSARMVLQDPTVEVAVLETARGGMLREGLAFDRCDVGAVLNVQEDHLGLKGVETLHDLAKVKSIVVEQVARHGASVLNADDPMTRAMARHAGGRIVYFSLLGGAEMPDFLRDHVSEGGMALVRRPGPNGGTLVLHERGTVLELMRAEEIPATLGGLADLNIQNALAAAAMAIAQGVEPAQTATALRGFATTFEQCPGRLNVHDSHGFRVIMDYAHNPAGLTALGQVITALRARHGRVIGMVNIPGDRRDEDMRRMGAIAAGLFDEIIFREDPARRGRRPGEIVGLLAQGCLAAGFPRDNIRCILDEDEAADVCLRRARSGDLVVLTPTDVEAMWQQVNRFDAGHPAPVLNELEPPRLGVLPEPEPRLAGGLQRG